MQKKLKTRRLCIVR